MLILPMKNLLFLFLLLPCFASNAQIINNVDISKLEEVQYIEVVSSEKFMSRKITIFVDYGQDTKIITRDKVQRIEDDKGVIVHFNSVTHALNYLYKHGWVYVDAYVVPDGNSKFYHYLLERKNEKDN